MSSGSGMTGGVRHAVVYLFILTVLLAAANLLWTAHEVNANTAAQARQAAVTKAAGQRAGQLLERKLCLSFTELAADKPPPGNPATNPSRAFDQKQHAILVGLGADLGCGHE